MCLHQKKSPLLLSLCSPCQQNSRFKMNYKYEKRFEHIQPRQKRWCFCAVQHHSWCFSLVTEALCNLLNQFVISSDSLKMRGLQLRSLNAKSTHTAPLSNADLKQIDPYWDQNHYSKISGSDCSKGFPKFSCCFWGLYTTFRRRWSPDLVKQRFISSDYWATTFTCLFICHPQEYGKCTICQICTLLSSTSSCLLRHFEKSFILWLGLVK